jgi:hypothetical protein
LGHNLFAQSSPTIKPNAKAALADASRGLMQDFFRQRRFDSVSERRRYPYAMMHCVHPMLFSMICLTHP